MEEIRLAQWTKENIPANEMIWKKSLEFQIQTISRIPMMLYRNARAESDYISKKYLKYGVPVFVIGTHTSKSIVCPVCKLDWKGITFIIQNNFHDWEVSVNSSDFPIDVDFEDIFVDTNISSVYCEGFSSEDVYGSYSKNKSQFTAKLADDNDLYFFFRKIWYSVRKGEKLAEPLHIVVQNILDIIPDDILRRETMFGTVINDLTAIKNHNLESKSYLQRWDRLETNLSNCFKYKDDIDPELVKRIYHIAFKHRTDIDNHIEERKKKHNMEG